jgi:hypothetical protein
VIDSPVWFSRPIEPYWADGARRGVAGDDAPSAWPAGHRRQARGDVDDGRAVRRAAPPASLRREPAAIGWIAVEDRLAYLPGDLEVDRGLALAVDDHVQHVIPVSTLTRLKIRVLRNQMRLCHRPLGHRRVLLAQPARGGAGVVADDLIRSGALDQSDSIVTRRSSSAIPPGGAPIAYSPLTL